MDSKDLKDIRLSDRIVYALEKALEQEDVQVAKVLVQALELTLTRIPSSADFVDRRGYPKKIEEAMRRMDEIQRKK